MSYDHYHISMMTKDNEVKELIVAQRKDMHCVVDWTGEVGDKDLLGEFDSVCEAISYAIEKLEEKFEGEILSGAGTPPEDLLKRCKNEKDGPR